MGVVHSAQVVSAGSLVLLRHGQSASNAVGVFTGWLDPGLTERGRAESLGAGRVLVAAGVAADVVHTSTLVRATLTAELVVAAQPGRPPLREDDRLDERHYGALTGHVKSSVLRAVGRGCFDTWRNSLTTAPPPLTEVGALNLVRGPWPASRLLPTGVRTESLGDILARVVPFWEQVLAPDLADGCTVCVVAHGNSLRTLMMFLDRLSQDELSQLRLSTGVPLRYQLTDELRPRVRGGEVLGSPRPDEGIAGAV